MSSKFWCFTENDCARDFWTKITDICDGKPQIKYMCGQLEQGTNLHFQGYIQLKTSKPLSYLRNQISDTAHWEKQKGTNAQAMEYCKKSDGTELPNTFIEYGSFNPGRGGKGARNDIVKLRDAILSGTSQRDLIMDPEHIHTYAKYIKFHDRVRSLFKPPSVEKEFKVILFVGEPGTGKTRKAFKDEPELFEIPISNGTLWMDGYDNHKTVLFDDFMGAGSKMSLDNTLKFFDRYVRCVPVKGSHVWYNPETVIVTSNYHPRFWYKWDTREPSWKALCRRFTEVWSFTKGQDPQLEDNEDYLNDQDQWPCLNEIGERIN